MLDALIPIGSVVRIAETDVLAVICGFYPDNGEELFDYLAAPYPIGLAGDDYAIFLDQEAIEEVVAPGYLDEQGEGLLKATVEMMNAREQAYVRIGRILDEAGELEGEDAGQDESEGASEGEPFSME